MQMSSTPAPQSAKGFLDPRERRGGGGGGGGGGYLEEIESEGSMKGLMNENAEEDLTLRDEIPLLVNVFATMKPALAGVIQRHVHARVNPVDDDWDDHRPNLHS